MFLHDMNSLRCMWFQRNVNALSDIYLFFLVISDIVIAYFRQIWVDCLISLSTYLQLVSKFPLISFYFWHMSLEVFEHVCETYSETDEGLMSNHQILNLHVGVQGLVPSKS